MALHDVRRNEEERGTVRWLRPDFQKTRAGAAQATVPVLALPKAVDAAPERELLEWPGDAVGQITALRQFAQATAVSIDEAATRFRGAPRAIVLRHLETLAILGEVRALEDGRYAATFGRSG